MTHALKPVKSVPALKLVKTGDLDRDQWLAVRKRGIGSSDAAAAVGLNPYKSQLELWMEKTGRDAGLPKTDPNDETSPMYWGTLLEPIVAAHYTKRTGNKVRRINAVLQHPRQPWMLANIDREVVGAPDVQILDQLGDHGVVALDAVHLQLLAADQHGHVGGLLAVDGQLVHHLELDVFGHAVFPESSPVHAGRLALELECRFWRHVEADTAPPADGSDSADVALRCLYPRDSGQTLDLSQDLEMCSAFSDLLAVRQVLATNVGLGEATRAIFEGGDVSWKRSKDGIALDTARLLKDRPELLETHGMAKPGSRRFLVNA